MKKKRAKIIFNSVCKCGVHFETTKPYNECPQCRKAVKLPKNQGKVKGFPNNLTIWGTQEDKYKKLWERLKEWCNWEKRTVTAGDIRALIAIRKKMEQLEHDAE